MNKFKILFLSLALSASMTIHAMNTAEICQWRGKMLASMAKARDEGISQRKTVDQIHKQFDKHGIKRSTINDYADAVYSSRDLSPNDFYHFGMLSCRQELGR